MREIALSAVLARALKLPAAGALNAKISCDG